MGSRKHGSTFSGFKSPNSRTKEARREEGEPASERTSGAAGMDKLKPKM
jgi:hypothetical protein